ncbi:MAG: 1-acyl-sn-glycerol-3-phosphate acyltransferase [Oscillospiraceae bacterium]|jgi:1-acyl-sn-glycerol-3-phosphate acyltransferase|nr:1-acyl-sn-glycerol-3-phosphate acyltransferase [Oscillospiraceae bacterium]
MDDYKRHLRVWSFFRKLLSPFVRRKFNISFKNMPDIPSPYIILSNHNTDWDPLLIGAGIKKHTYFVASEHIFRHGLLSKLLIRYLAPISRRKGSTDSATAISVLRHLRKGHSVCIFAEGNRSFCGITEEIHPSTCKLVKSAGVPLITLKFTGGYLTSPRWSFTMRRGRMTCETAGIYTPEQLKQLSPCEIEDIIRRDLYENSDERQKSEPVAFKGKRLAEGLEHVLHLCPKCGKSGNLFGNGDIFSCTCGLSVKYTEFGTLQSSGTQFETVAQWDKWQTEQIYRAVELATVGLDANGLASMESTSSKPANAELTSAPSADGLASSEPTDTEFTAIELASSPAFSDEPVKLIELTGNHGETELLTGRLSIDREHLLCGDMNFPLSEISDINIYSRRNLIFTHSGRHYEIHSDQCYCARKYIIYFKAVQKYSKTKGM